MKNAFRTSLLKLFVLIAALSCSQRAAALSFALDSISEWGVLPRLCINVYRWGDEFFNSSDSNYVAPTGAKFNIKAVTNSEWDNYLFQLSDDTSIEMNSNPATTMGVHLTYLALSGGYDLNIGKSFGGARQTKKRYRLGIECQLVSFEAYWERNNNGATLTRFGDFDDRFNQYGLNKVNINSYGADLYYFFNNKRYSQRAAFTFGKVQKRSVGSFYAGLSYYMQDYNIDFNALPTHMLELLPTWWDNYTFKMKTYNYGFRLGYGYNWVFAPNWVLGATFSPTVAVSKGIINSEKEEFKVSLFLRGKLSVVWNSPKYRWFIGVIGKVNSAVVSDRQTYFLGNVFTVSAAAGFRFNIWLKGLCAKKIEQLLIF